jgi:hypothetical protein
VPDAMNLENLAPVAVEELAGTWHIIETDFPMWLTGKKTEPTLNYRVREGSPEGGFFVEDLVRYVAGGRQREIRGVNTLDRANRAHFTWRGRGLLALLTSDWYVIHLDRAAGVLATYFSPTLFTPAGVDLCARSPEPAEGSLESARAAIAAFPGLSDHARKLTRLKAAPPLQSV